MNKTRIYLIRHGAVWNPRDIAYGRLPIPLSEEGRNQIESLAGILEARGETLAAIYSSPVARVRQSAEIIRDRLGAGQLELTDDLSDVDVGTMEGQPMQITRDVGYKAQELRKMGYKIETSEDIITRVRRVIDQVILKHPGEAVALLSHGDVVRLGLWSCDFPGQEPLENLRDNDYLAVGEAVILTFEGETYAGREFIRREQSPSIEVDNIRRTEAY